MRTPERCARLVSSADSESDAAYNTVFPLESWPDIPTRFVLCTEDRVFPPDFMRRIVFQRLGITPDEIGGGHCVALSRPQELTDLLVGYTAEPARRSPDQRSRPR
jgi:hypothetical protein